MKIFIYLGYFFRSVRLRGLRNTLRLIGAERRYERLFGIQTVAMAAPQHPDFFHYQGASYLVLMRLFGELDAGLKRFRFFDIGSGKGRAVFAGEYCGFNQLEGIELDEQLVETARQNAKRYRFKRNDSSINFITANALSYNFPDTPTVYFLFNPFSAVVLKQVVTRILSGTTAETWFIYMNPLFRTVFDEVGLVCRAEVKTNKYLEAVIYTTA